MSSGDERVLGRGAPEEPTGNPFNTDADHENMGGMFGAGEVTPSDTGGAMPGGPTGGYGGTMLGGGDAAISDSGAASGSGNDSAGATGAAGNDLSDNDTTPDYGSPGGSESGEGSGRS
jgi:hypothetical protein